MGKYDNTYRNHVYRVYHLTLIWHQSDLTRLESEALAIAIAFHDMGIWTHHTMDYLGPSEDLVVQYWKENEMCDLF